MASESSSISVLLLQARNTIDIEIQEQECFLERCRIEADQLSSVNLARVDTLPDVSILDDFDAFFIGGAGEYSAAENYPWMPFALDLIRYAHDASLPTFGSCWGHQLIARSLGGRVEHDPEKAELGCHHVYLTGAGSDDELFTNFPLSFLVNMGHHDRVTKLPSNGLELANNQSQPNEAFRIIDKPMYGTQFHSELDRKREEERLHKYRPYYLEQMGDEEVFQNIVNSLRETTEVDHLMYDFLCRFTRR